MDHRKQRREDFVYSFKEQEKRFMCLNLSRGKIMALSFMCIVLLAIVITVPAVVLTAKNGDHSRPLRVGAFNIRKFGKSKICNHVTANSINTILQRYDIVLVLEVMDISQTSITNLLHNLKTTDKSWKYVSSERLGRTSYKEQYVFYYKSNSVTVEDQYQVSDEEDVFEREPFAIKITYHSVSHGEKRRIALAGIHIKPSKALAELSELPEAIEDISQSFKYIDGVIMMGDYNAACSYLSKKRQNSLPIFSSDKYQNLISHTMDTTVAKGDCAYDRVTVYGSEIDVRDAKVYRFDKDLDMNMTEAFTVSDHYPVEFLLY